MGFKNHDSCLDKVAADEPIFVLRGQDLSTPAIIREWVRRNPQIGQDKRIQAETDAHDIEVWQVQNPVRVKRAD